MKDLTILCVTKGEAYGLIFRQRMSILAQLLGAEMVFAADSCFDTLEANIRDVVVSVKSEGYIESILDVAVGACSGRYILRLDDDEAVSPAMERWLQAQTYLTKDHWCFPRFHLFPDVQHSVITPPYFPDWQTRLSTAEKSGGRPKVHAASPFGMGTIACVGIEHYELLAKTQEERARLAQHYYEIAGLPCSWEAAMQSQPESWPVPPVTRNYSDGSIRLREIE